ncbi:MAG: B12-binding domain-containing radical SAM protein [Bryobacteraceae bacterium]
MKVLVVTGGLLTEKETSVWRALRKSARQWRASEHAWLDLKIKLVFAEMLASKPRRAAGENSPPDLTEVVLATLLHQQGVPYVLATYDDLFARPDWAARQLAECDCVLASTTFLRDLSEVEPLVKMLKRPHNRIVLGGPLAGILDDRWEGMPEVDVLAAGYGEFLVPALVEWMRSDYATLEAPPGGRVVRKRHTTIVYSGVPPTQDLDFLPTPDWALSQRDRSRRYRMIYYESVRGCPYRCNFCNYPYLFADSRFRYKSARRMLEEWERYLAGLDVEYITCLDSLFTMPRRRLEEFCRGLIERRTRVKWICYARADDLADPSIAALMREAGAHQVQIGLESGDQGQLDNMDKACSVESNARAIDNCRRFGITSVVSLIVGFPGETAGTLERTYEFMRAHPPDFYFLATFSTRATGVPVMNEYNRRRFDLRTVADLKTAAPYWSHRTMTCGEAGNHVRELHRRLMREGVSLNAALFFDRMLDFRPEDRAALLARQQTMAHRPVLAKVFDRLNRFVDRRIASDVSESLA